MEGKASSSASENTTWPEDALQAVKQDPAVLDVQISVASNSDASDVGSPEPEKLPPIPEHFTKDNKNKDSPDASMFEEMLKMQKAALLSLAPEQFEILLLYADLLRKQRQQGKKQFECAFCKNNGEPSSWYSTHILKDKRGRVRCPVLRVYRCPLCGVSGDHAHTIKYCPENFDTGLWSRGR